MEHYIARPLFLRVLIGCLVAAIVAAQNPIQLKVFRGTLVHSRVRTEMEMLEDYLIGIDEAHYGTVSCSPFCHQGIGTTVLMSAGFSGLLPASLEDICAKLFWIF